MATCMTRTSIACRLRWVRCAPPPISRWPPAYVLPLGGQGQDQIIELLARNKPELRRIIGKKLELKYAPDLRFRLDETFDQMDETRRLFAQDEVRRDLDE